MKNTTREKLYKIDRALTLVYQIASIVVLVFLLLTAFIHPLKYVFFALLILWGLILIAKICFAPFVKSEDEEEFEQKVEYILQRKIAHLSAILGDYTPLHTVTPEQVTDIKQLLRELPDHVEKPGHINLALTAQYLTALEKLGKADLSDKHHLRLWVAEVTGKQVPSSSQFNEAVPSQAKTKVNDARKELQKLLS